MDTYWLSPDWTRPLQEAGLNSLVALLMYTEGRCLSMHSRGSTFRSTLPNGQTVYIKRDHFTLRKDICDQLLHASRPHAKCIREQRIFQRVRQAGFHAPEVIAAGYRTVLGLPTAAGIVMLPVDGTPLDEFLRHESDPQKRNDAITRALAELDKLQKAGCDWPDCKPEHFILMPDGNIGLIDLERLRFRHAPLSQKRCQWQIKHFHRYLP